MSRQGAWTVTTATGTAQELHDRPRPDPMERAVVVCRTIGRCVVLGSTQVAPPPDLVPLGAAVARRTSGGGAVWVGPGELLWIDVDLPRADRLWDDDVSRSSLWLGRAWSAALGTLSVTRSSVHDGPMRPGPAGRALCFAGLGPGEVCVAGRKVVGISQRRSRAGTRFHCAALLRWSPVPLARVMEVPEHLWPELPETAAGLALDPEALTQAFLAVLQEGQGFVQ